MSEKIQDSRFKRLFQNKKTKRLVIVFTAIFFMVFVFFLLRGPYLSNSMKRIFQPMFENAIGEKVIIDKAVINLFPFYLQTKGFKVFDEEGNRLLIIKKMRIYIDLTRLLTKEISIRRLTINEPQLSIDRVKMEKIIKTLMAKRDDDLKVRIKSLKIKDGSFILTDKEKGLMTRGNGLHVRAVFKQVIDIDLSIREGNLKLGDLPEWGMGLTGRVNISDKNIKLHGIKIDSLGSTLEAGGDIQLSHQSTVERGIISGSANILIKTIAEVFGLKESKEGSLSISGSIDLDPQLKINLKTKGWFYLQTLMELLRVNENISGRISLDGKISGIYPEIKGDGMVTAKDVNISTLWLNHVEGKIGYENKRFTLKDFIANAFSGEIKGRASILIPSAEYSVVARATNISSPEFFKFIGWEPPFPNGKIDGDFSLYQTPGEKLRLEAKATYLNTIKGDTFLQDRLKRMDADIDMKEGVLTFNDAILSTSVSKLSLTGDINFVKKELDLKMQIKSDDIVDLTSPYFEGLRSPVKFSGRTRGPIENPEISGSISMESGSINGQPFTEISGDLLYSPKLLSVKLLKIKQNDSVYEASGSIAFRKAEGLFSFKDPYYRWSVLLKNGDAKLLIAAIYKEMPIGGVINGRGSFDGDEKEFKGDADIKFEKGVVFSQLIDRGLIKATLTPENVKFTHIGLQRNNSKVNASGSIYFDKRFDVAISSESINSIDLKVLNKYPLKTNFSLDIKGAGTFDKPNVKFSTKISEANFKGIRIRNSSIIGELINRKFSANGSFHDGLIAANANATLSKELPWDLNITFKNGRYDTLLTGILKDIPKDFAVSIQGIINAKGKRDRISMGSRFSSLNFSLYGFSFKNKEDIVLEFIDNSLRINSLSISGEDGDVIASGAVKIGENYNLFVRGMANLTPLRVLFKDVESLRGKGDFEIDIIGRWEKPEFKGKVSLRDCTLMMIGFPNKIGPLSGDIFFDKERITFDSFSGEFGGGRVLLSGVGSLEGLSLKRLFLSSTVEGIKLRPVEDVDIVFDGRLYFESLQNKRSLVGDINVKKARYKKRVEWKSWLLKLKEAKEVPLKPSFIRDTALNIHITGQDNIFIDNNIAKTKLKVNLNLQGKVAQYGLIGRAETKDGTVFFRNNEFKIVNGSIDFIEPDRISPVFHVLSKTTVSGYNIRLEIDGPADRFTLVLFSDPPLSDTDILTLLTTGRTVSASKGIQGGIGAAEATSFLTGRLQDVVEERFKIITGLERFEINPQTTATGSISPKVTVGKRILGERLFITYSTTIGTTEESIIKIQYDIGKNFSLIGSRDEIGSIGGDVKYRFEFR